MAESKRTMKPTDAPRLVPKTAPGPASKAAKSSGPAATPPSSLKRDWPQDVHPEIPQPHKHAFPYWMVWRRSNKKKRPNFRWATEDAAYAEAERLAAANPGGRFYVICVVGARKVEAPVPDSRQAGVTEEAGQ